jgi:hypothetical protein
MDRGLVVRSRHDRQGIHRPRPAWWVGSFFFRREPNMRVLFLAVAALLLAGCGSAQEHAAHAVI